jgi:hypothetical protein
MYRQVIHYQDELEGLGQVGQKTLPGWNTYGTSNTPFIPVNFLTLHHLQNLVHSFGNS